LSRSDLVRFNKKSFLKKENGRCGRTRGAYLQSALILDNVRLAQKNGWIEILNLPVAGGQFAGRWPSKRETF
jgi:hypothetical protein